MDGIDIAVKTQEIPRALKDLSPIDLMLTLVRLVDDKNLKAIFVQNYIQKHGPIPDEYADEVKKALEE